MTMLLKALGVVLLVAGVLILVYHGFSIPKSHDAKLGPIEVTMKESERVEIPVWVGVVAVAAGGASLLWAGQKK
jgi:protein-S-isoprenylcysteine O-methyltransferase Ste14